MMAIKIKPSKKGSFRSAMGTPKGKNIPMSKITKAEHSSSPALRKKAVFAANARKWGK